MERRTSRDWVLFLDRDGVINRRVVDGYVRNWSEFEFLPGARQAVADLSMWAPHVVVVTNQQGVGKGLVSQQDLSDIHARMSEEVRSAGGRIDDVLICPHLVSEECICRKPKPGLALAWLSQHPNVDASLSVMVGDSASDMEMLDALRSHTGGGDEVLIQGLVAERLTSAPLPTACSSLADFAAAVSAALTGDQR